MSDTLQLCCRVCLELAGEQVSALTNATLRLHLEACLAITVADSDELPTNVCAPCVARLREFYAFRTSARNSQDWLEATVRAARRNKSVVQPLADSDYNSDSLLEFLNNTENIEEYLDGLGDADSTLPSLVGLLDRQPDASLEFAGKLMNGGVKVTKITSTKAEEARRGRDDTYEIHMEIDVLDSDADVIEEAAVQEAGDASFAPAVEPVEKEAYACLACKATFEELGALGAHMSVCESATRTCFECGLQFDSKQKMMKHRVSHVPADASVCDACGKKFANRARRLQHYEKCHNDFVASMGCVYRCKECGDLFRDRFQLYRHAKEHVVSGEAAACDVCGDRTADLAEHKRTRHGTDGPNVLYRCKVCRVVCADRRQLYAHVKQHTAALAPQRHLCHACGKSYTSLAALNRHVVTHVGDKYKCRHCQKECADADALWKHTHMHERESAVCEFCGLTFLKFDFLQKHLKELHS